MPRTAKSPEIRHIQIGGNHWQISAHVGECYGGELDLTVTEIFCNGTEIALKKNNVEQAKRLFTKDLL